MNTRKSILALLAVMLILALVTAGCQSSQSRKGLLEGEYSRNGFLLTVEQGRFSIGGKEDEGGSQCEVCSYTLDGDKIIFNTEKFSDGCEPYCGKYPTYTYQWSFDAGAGQLTLKAIEDPCDPRLTDFTLMPLAYNQLAK